MPDLKSAAQPPHSYLLPKVSALKTIKPTKTWAVVLLAVALLLFIALGVSTIVKHNNKIQFQKVELQSTAAKLKLLQQQYNVQLQNKNVDETKLKELEQQKSDLEKQLAAKQEAKRVADAQAAQAQAAATRLANAVTQTKTAYAATGGCNDAKSCIYYHESGNNPAATNSIGCFGLGQDCNGIVRSLCGTNYACQDNYFTSYMARRYGTWEHAWQVWQYQRWW